MNYIYETAMMLNISLAELCELIGVSLTNMSDIIEGIKLPSASIIKSCQMARKIFLKRNNTQRVKGEI